MNPSNNCENDSDVGSTSSWTVLENSSEKFITSQDSSHSNPVVPEINQACFCLCNDSGCKEFAAITYPAQESVVNLESFGECDYEIKDEVNEVHSGCLTLEEYMLEQELLKEFDYVGYDGKRKCNDKPARRKKCKSQSLGTLTVISTVMAVAGVSFLCLLAPNNYSLNSKELHKLKIHHGGGSSKTPKSMPVCPVYSDKNHRLSVSDPENVISALLINNDTSDLRKTSKNIKNTKALKSLGNINLLMDSYHVVNVPKSSKNDKMQNSSLGVFYGPEVPPTKQNANREKAKLDNSEDIYKVFSLNSCKILCNIVRDLMLLRVLHNSKEVKCKRENSKKTLKQGIKQLRQTKEEKHEPKYDLDTLRPSDSKTDLTKKTQKRCKNETVRYERLRAYANKKKSLRLKVPTVTTSEDNLIKNMLDKTNNKVDEFLHNLESEQMERKLEIAKERSRRQESYMNLIKQRENFVKNQAPVPREIYSPTLRRNEAIKQLHKIKAEYDLTARVHDSNTKDDISAACYELLSEYLTCEKEQTEKQNQYWIKRDEFLRARLTFLHTATDAIRLIVNDYQNNNALAIKSVEKIVEKSAEVLPHDSGVKQLQNLLKSEFPEPRYRILNLQTLSDINKNAASSSETLDINCVSNEDKSCNSIVPRTKENGLKSHEYYDQLFGKMGHQIRKKDMGIFYCSDVLRTCLQKNVSKHDPRKKTSNDFIKK